MAKRKDPLLHCAVSFAIAASLMIWAAAAGAMPFRVVWTPAGYGGGGRFTAVTVDPFNPQNVYVGSDVAGIFRSRDGGDHFSLFGKGLNGFAVAGIAVNPSEPRQVLVLTDDGLYQNVGDHWEQLSGDIGYPSRFFGSQVLLFTQKSLWIAADTHGVYQIPLSNLKTPARHIQGLDGCKVNGLAVYDGYLYAGTSRGVYFLKQGRWIPQQEGLPQGHLDIQDIAASGNVLYGLEKTAGLFCWNPQSRTWSNRPVTLRPPPKDYKSVAVPPGDSSVVLIGSHPENWPHRLYKSQDGGKTWASITSFQVDPQAPANWTQTLTGVEDMIFTPGNEKAMFMTDWWNLWQSSDAGNHWVQKFAGLQNTVVNDIQKNPKSPSTLYLCTADNGLMVSEDTGQHWRRSMNGVSDGHAQAIAISENDPSRMVLLMNPWDNKGRIYVYESRDAGNTWRDIGFPRPAEALPHLGYVDGMAGSIVMDPFDSDILYAGANGYGVYKTVNNGKDWFPVNNGLTVPYIRGAGALWIDPRHPSTLFAATQSGGIYKSADSGGTWRQMTHGNLFVFGIAADSADPSRMVAGCAGNTVLTTQDGGAAWKEVRLPVPSSSQMAVNCVAFAPGQPKVVMAGTIRYDVRAAEGLFVSTDGAASFQKVPMDIPAVNINAIILNAGQPISGYIGFNGIGLFRIELKEP